MLVFNISILRFVIGIQLSVNDMHCLGNRITVLSFNIVCRRSCWIRSRYRVSTYDLYYSSFYTGQQLVPELAGNDRIGQTACDGIQLSWPECHQVLHIQQAWHAPQRDTGVIPLFITNKKDGKGSHENLPSRHKLMFQYVFLKSKTRMSIQSFSAPCCAIKGHPGFW